MPVRILKVVLVAWASLLCLIYAAQNVANVDAAYSAIAYVLSLQDHVVYPNSIGPAVTHPVLVWATVVFIFSMEFAAGGLAAKGAWDMWCNRRADAARFHASKTYAILGAGLAVIVWMGLFSVVGGGLFQMWQTDVGAGSLAGAFQYLGMSAFVLIFISQRDEALITG